MEERKEGLEKGHKEGRTERLEGMSKKVIRREERRKDIRKEG